MEEILQALAAKASSLRNGIPSKPVDSQAINGTFNSVYFIRFADGVEWAARVSIDAISRGRPLPADDIDRFASEISSLRWLSHNTSVKIPELYAWNIPKVWAPEGSHSCWPPARGLAADDVPWMLMEKLPGIPLSYEIWDSFEDHQRQKILAQVADLFIELSRHRFSEIGSIHLPTEPKPRPTLDRRIYRLFSRPASVSPDDRLAFTSICRDSFSSAADPTLRTMLSHVHDTILDISSTSPNTFLLAHPDLNPSNIIHDPATLSILGFIDWDCAHTVSLAEFCIHPWFIQDRWYVDWQPEELERNQTDRSWFTSCIRMKMREINAPGGRDELQLASRLESSTGVYLLGQFLHDTICVNPDSLAAVQRKLGPRLLAWRKGQDKNKAG